MYWKSIARDDLPRRHVGEQLPERLAGRLACRSHTALTIAAIEMWMTPFCGPSQRSCESPASSRQNAAGVGRRSRRRRGPTTSGAKARIASAQISLPRPMVKVKPCPSSAAVGVQDDVGGGVVGILVHGVGAGVRQRRREPQVDDVESGDLHVSSSTDRTRSSATAATMMRAGDDLLHPVGQPLLRAADLDDRHDRRADDRAGDRAAAARQAAAADDHRRDDVELEADRRRSDRRPTASRTAAARPCPASAAPSV